MSEAVIRDRRRSKMRDQLKVLWTNWMQTAPSPTADAPRFTLLARASPIANTQGRLVSKS
jgi:hypothetical protein